MKAHFVFTPGGDIKHVALPGQKVLATPIAVQSAGECINSGELWIHPLTGETHTWTVWPIPRRLPIDEKQQVADCPLCVLDIQTYVYARYYPLMILDCLSCDPITPMLIFAYHRGWRVSELTAGIELINTVFSSYCLRLERRQIKGHPHLHIERAVMKKEEK